jgi:hypothetical protein
MSNLLVQNIKHTNNTTSMAIDTSGQVTIRGESSATTTNLQQGLNKAWCHWNQDSTQAIRDSLNIATITDNATGATTLTFTNSMANANFAFVGFGSQHIGTAAGYCAYETDAQTTSQSNKFQSITVGGSNFDAQSVHATLNGDLA